MTDKMNLTIEQQEAVSEIDRNLQIIACAGSGKTEVITRRIANILKSRQDILPENIVAFTFTNKAAESMKKRIEKALENQECSDIDSMYIGTIHSFCYNLLNQYTDRFSDFRILDSVKSHLFVKRYSDECGMGELNLEPRHYDVNIFLQCIDKMIDDYDNADNWTQEQRDALNNYMDCLYSHKYIDFALIIFETLRQIEENSKVQEYISQIKYLVVDEYQDVNDLQEKLIHRISEAGANICVVGDDDQTIYQFRGSNANNMITFAERYDELNQVRLEKNFRCAPGIVDVADCVIEHNKRRIDKKMISGVENLQAQIKARRYQNKEEQFDAIAEKISELHETGIPYREMAVLVRKGKIIDSISAALARLGIPSETESAEDFFAGDYYNRFVSTLQALSETDKEKIIECWQDVIDMIKLDVGINYLEDCLNEGKNRPLSEVIRGFCEETGFLDDTAPDIDIRNMELDGITIILDDYDEIYRDWQLSSRINGVIYFLEKHAPDEYKYFSFRPKDPDGDAVQIMTVHKAKGLEFNTVFIPELVNREFPVGSMGGRRYYHVLEGVFRENKARYDSDMEDERKLFYVAVTRAKQNLYLTYAKSSKSVSCFVSEAAESDYLDIDRREI